MHCEVLLNIGVAHVHVHVPGGRRRLRLRVAADGTVQDAETRLQLPPLQLPAAGTTLAQARDSPHDFSLRLELRGDRRSAPAPVSDAAAASVDSTSSKWSAASEGATSQSLACGRCGAGLEQGDHEFQRVLPLPSSGWQDLVGAISCHDEVPDSLRRPSLLQPRLGVLLVGEGFVLAAASDLNMAALMLCAEQSVADGTRRLRCARCRWPLGLAILKNPGSELSKRSSNNIYYSWCEPAPNINLPPMQIPAARFMCDWTSPVCACGAGRTGKTSHKPGALVDSSRVWWRRCCAGAATT